LCTPPRARAASPAAPAGAAATAAAAAAAASRSGSAGHISVSNELRSEWFARGNVQNTTKESTRRAVMAGPQPTSKFSSTSPFVTEPNKLRVVRVADHMSSPAAKQVLQKETQDVCLSASRFLSRQSGTKIVSATTPITAERLVRNALPAAQWSKTPVPAPTRKSPVRTTYDTQEHVVYSRMQLWMKTPARWPSAIVPIFL